MPPHNLQKNLRYDDEQRPQTQIFPEKLDGPDYFELDGKKFYAYMELELIICAFSKHFSEHAQMPNYYVNQIGKHGVWDEIEVDEPISRVREFLPHSRYPDWIKLKHFFKAQRAYHDVLCSQILSHFFICRLNELHYQGDPLSEIYMQSVTVNGHTTPILENEERYVVPAIHRICCIFLRTKGGTELYVDICGPQIDINHMSNGRLGVPVLMFRITKEGDKRQPMAVGELYCPDQNRNVKIIEVEDLIPVQNDKLYKKYIANLIEGSGGCADNNCSHIDCEKEIDNSLLGEDEELIVEYHERISQEFKERVNQAMKRVRNRIKKQSQKAKNRAKKVAGTHI